LTWGLAVDVGASASLWEQPGELLGQSPKRDLGTAVVEYLGFQGLRLELLMTISVLAPQATAQEP